MAIKEIIILVFSSLGLLDTLYLAYHSVKRTPVACWWFPLEWCLKVQQSPQSRLVFGIPNAFLGLGMYVFLLIYLILSQGSLTVLPLWPFQAVITLGFAFSLYFTYIQAFVLRAFCTWCVISAFNFLAMFLAVWLL